MAFNNLWCIIPLASHNTETGSLYTITLNRGETIFRNDVSPHTFLVVWIWMLSNIQGRKVDSLTWVKLKNASLTQ
jgi:hypothetical protein